MMKRKTLPILGLTAALAMSVGCLSMQNQTTLDAIQGSGSPFVEAYIEYPGPHERWAGPVNFVLHVLAKDSGAAQVSLAPALYQPAPPKGAVMGNRVPSSAGYGMAMSQGMPGEMARERLGRLATELQGAEQPFRGCLYPIRVRLIRADGAVTEKHGCRGQGGWTKASSEVVSDFITASVYGMQGLTAPGAPAAKEMPPAAKEAPKAMSEGAGAAMATGGAATAGTAGGATMGAGAGATAGGAKAAEAGAAVKAEAVPAARAISSTTEPAKKAN